VVDIDDLIVCFSIGNNSYDDFFYTPAQDLQNNDSHINFFSKIVEPKGFGGLNLDKFDSYMLGDMIFHLFS
jgi:hypothetical protein